MTKITNDNSKERVVFVKSFKHWKSGKIIRAEDYGKEAFAIKIHQ